MGELQVKVALKHLTDWMLVWGEQPVGLFTPKVIQPAQEERTASLGSK